MTGPLTLHYAPDNASLCVRLALEEMGLDYRTVLVDRRRQDQRSAAYLALNPNGLIPVLQTPHGPIFETAAILLWLAETTGSLFPAPGDPARGAALKWLVWMSATLHPAERMLFTPGRYAGTAPAGAIAAAAAERIARHLDVLQAAGDADFLERAPTITGCYLAPLLRWPAIYCGAGLKLERWPRLMDFARMMERRPATIRAAAAEGLGPKPFSQPRLPEPPEGSAT